MINFFFFEKLNAPILTHVVLQNIDFHFTFWFASQIYQLFKYNNVTSKLGVGKTYVDYLDEFVQTSFCRAQNKKMKKNIPYKIQNGILLWGGKKIHPIFQFSTLGFGHENLIGENKLRPKIECMIEKEFKARDGNIHFPKSITLYTCI